MEILYCTASLISTDNIINSYVLRKEMVDYILDIDQTPVHVILCHSQF